MSKLSHISDTTLALLIHAKKEKTDFELDAIKKVLAPIYSPDMNLGDVLLVVHRSLLELMGESRFQVGKSADFFLEIILAPAKLNGSFSLRGDPLKKSSNEKYTLDEFYGSILGKMMFPFRVAHVGWCDGYFNK